MTTEPNFKITAGLAARPTLDELRPKMKTGSPVTKSQAHDLAISAEKVLGLLNSVLASNAVILRNATLPYRQLIEMSDSKVRRDEIQKLSDDLEKEKRKELKAQTEISRYEALRQLQEMDALASTSSEYFQNPISLLTASNIGSEKRDRVANQLNGLGPAAIKSLAQAAINNNDRELGAELVRANDSKKAKDRPFKSSDLAEHLVGAEVQAAKDLLMNVKRSVQTAINANKSFENGKPQNPNSKIANALNFKNIPALEDIA